MCIITKAAIPDDSFVMHYKLRFPLYSATQNLTVRNGIILAL